MDKIDARKKNKKNVNLNFDTGPVGLVRYPVLPSSAFRRLAACNHEELVDCVRSYVAIPWIREALYLASPGLYDRILMWERAEGNFNGLEISIARYLLRMSFRATPFGGFAGVAACEVGAQSLSIVVPSREAMRRAVQMDVSVMASLADLCVADPTFEDVIRFYPNDTLDIETASPVYVKFDRGHGGRKIYRRIEVESSFELRMVLDAAKMGSTRSELVRQLCNSQLAVDANEAREFIDELITAQILVADHLVDITSTDMLKTLIECLDIESEFVSKLNALHVDLEVLNREQTADATDFYRRIEDKSKSLFANSTRRTHVKVDLFCENTQKVQIDVHTISQLENILSDLYSWKTTDDSSLTLFKERFSERYGEAEVDLLRVADDLAFFGVQISDAPRPIITRGFEPHRKKQHSTPRLLERLLSASRVSAEHYVTLEEDDLSLYSKSEGIGPKSKGLAWIALWMSETTNRPVIELRGIHPHHPGRIMGRFSGHLPTLKDYLFQNDSDDHSQDALIVEIVHCPQDGYGNISARPTLTEYEIGVRAGPSATACRIPLRDLAVSVSSGRVHVRSKSMDRQLNIRMSNAHNSNAPGCLPIYKFLNLVARQDSIFPELGIARDAPNAQFIPGLVYKGVIISRPGWKISSQDTEKLRRTPLNKRADLIQHWRATRNLPDWVAITSSDNSIPYHLDSEWMVLDLIKGLIKAESTILRDVFPLGMNPFSTNCEYHSHHEILLPYSPAINTIKSASKELICNPGDTIAPIWSEWVFFKLYVRLEDQDRALTDLKPVVSEMLDDGLINCFFFIRYRDKHGEHLRLRFKVPSGCAMLAVTPRLTDFFSDRSARGHFTDVCVATYVREVSRYGGSEALNLCEQIFCHDSLSVMNVVETSPDKNISVAVVARATDSLLRALGLLDLEERLAFAARAAGNFASEFKFESPDRHRAGELYRSIGNVLLDRDCDQASKEFQQRWTSIAEVFSQLLNGPGEKFGKDQLYRIRWSIVHMRCNRLFKSEARLQEALMWELLRRSYVSLNERLKSRQ
ncbi:lantibiotic dehydratase [Rhodanobacter sp. 7MK24]|uniref:lantibiotic dehydratase n=1 Tax=Rhodanobacter sp. 7MK24 TaxID=2775922 RepID=UPI00177F7573|nr:lantibiotic dehydratase [Rhodanobacter sp. 7MK24]MBD8882429.1 lantibiotic dehydratase [Rhodanobacter sp. 7MK24]